MLVAADAVLARTSDVILPFDAVQSWGMQNGNEKPLGSGRQGCAILKNAGVSIGRNGTERNS